jgi:SAM-dependent methyltransferase
MKNATKQEPSELLAIQDILERRTPPIPWEEGDNIPWNEPEFSRRMLAAHLSQAHDLASRRSGIIDTHVEFIDYTIGRGRRARVIDLGCGPGLYLHRLALLGHRGVGIDFSPASIEHARRVAKEEGLECTFQCTDLRQAPFGDGFDAALLLFGQINVFTRQHALDILTRAYGCLAAGGVLILEPQHPSVVREDGKASSDWSAASQGLFSAAAHLLLHERAWEESSRSATDRWYVIDAERSTVRRYAMTTCSYEPLELQDTLLAIGFDDVTLLPSLAVDGDDEVGPLFALVARK